MLGKLIGIKIRFSNIVTDRERASLEEVIANLSFVDEHKDWYEDADEEDIYSGLYTVTEYATKLSQECITFNDWDALDLVDHLTPQAVGKFMKREYVKLYKKEPKTKPYQVKRSDGTIDTFPACAYTEDDHDFFIMCILRLSFGERI